MNDQYFCRNFPNVNLHQFTSKKQKLGSENNRLYGRILVLISQAVVCKKKLNDELDHRHAFFIPHYPQHYHYSLITTQCPHEQPQTPKSRIIS